MNSINFLAFFWDDIARDIVLIVDGMIRSLFYTICSAVYKMIYYFYNIFTLLCNGQLLDSDKLTNLFSRVGLLLGIVMSFRLALTFVQSLVDPDSAFDGKKGVPGVIKKVIIVIIMFGMSQYAFELSRDVQVLIIKNNVIPNLILPAHIDTNNFGGALAANFFTAFYNVDSRLDDNLREDVCAEPYINNLQKSIANDNDFGYMKNECLKATGEIDDGNVKTKDFLIEFNYIFCLLVGIAVLWFLINYCIQVGMRIIQLTVLQIISPMAFLSYLSPKDENMFTKWWKLYFSTYIDVFIRIAIIDFVCYICALIMTEWNSGNGIFWKSVGNPTGFVRIVVGIMMILAMFQFAKKAPELIKSLFPTGAAGSVLSMGAPNLGRVYSGLGAAAIGGVAGGLTSAIARGQTARIQGKSALSAGLGGFLSGSTRNAVKGLRGGMKSLPQNMSKQREIDNKYDEMVAGGGTTLGMLRSKAGDIVGYTSGQYQSRQLSYNQQVQNAWSDMKKEWEDSDSYNEWDRQYQVALHSGDSAKADALKQARNKVRDEWISRALNNDQHKIQIDYDGAGGISIGNKIDENGVEEMVGAGEVASYGRVRNLQSSTANMIETTGLKLGGNANEAFNNIDAIKNASDAAANNINKIYDEGYYKHQAEDKAAGVTINHKPMNFKDNNKK